MHELYDYRRICTQPRSWPNVIEQVRARTRPAVEAGGGTFYGLFLPQIGLAASEGVLISAWPNREALQQAMGRRLEGVDDVTAEASEPLIATVRPERALAPPPGGVYAHRFFEIEESAWPEFLALSEGAWVGFEKNFDAEIQGFFRSLDVEAPAARVLLLTRYASLAVWEASRMASERTPEQDEVRARFLRRHELTSSTVVVTTQLAPV